MSLAALAFLALPLRARGGEALPSNIVPLPGDAAGEAERAYLARYLLSNVRSALQPGGGGERQAREFAGIALRDNPRDPVILQTAAHIEERLGNWSAAAALLATLSEVSPEDYRVPFWEAHAQARLGKFARARELYRLSAERASSGEAAAVNEAAASLDALRGEMREAAARGWESVSAQAERFGREGGWAELERLADSVLWRQPFNGAAFAARGLARMRMGRAREAETDYSEALERDLPEAVRANAGAALAEIRERAQAARDWETAAALEAEGRLDELDAHFSGMLRRRPEDGAALSSRGFIRHSLGRTEEAREDFTRALALELPPETREAAAAALALIDRDAALAERQRRGTAAAEERLRLRTEKDAVAAAQALELESARARDWTAVEKEVALLEEKPDWRGIEAAYTRFLEKYPDHIWARASRGFMRRTLGLNKEALADFAAVLDREELTGEARANIAEAAGRLRLDMEEGRTPANPKAEPLLTDAQQRSDALWRLAEHHRETENKDEAIDRARESAALVPDNGWRGIDVGLLFAGYGMHGEAIYYLERALASGGVADKDAYFAFPALAAAYNQLGRRECSLAWTRRYIDAMGGRTAAEPVPHEEHEALYAARRGHALLSRRFGASVSTFYASFDNGDYMAQSYSEFTCNFGTFRNIGVEAYLNAVASVSRFSGVYYEPTLRATLPYASDSRVADTAHLVAGVRMRPPVLGYGLTLGIEQVIGLGRDVENDTRLRASYSREFGFDPEPCARNWLYAYTANDLLYSTRENDLTFYGEQRLGRSFAADSAGRLAVTPFAGASAGYGGKGVPADQRVSVEAGPGVHLRKWFREDKYNASRSTFDIIVQYRFGLTRGRNNAFSVSAGISF